MNLIKTSLIHKDYIFLLWYFIDLTIRFYFKNVTSPFPERCGVWFLSLVFFYNYPICRFSFLFCFTFTSFVLEYTGFYRKCLFFPVPLFI